MRRVGKESPGAASILYSCHRLIDGPINYGQRRQFQERVRQSRQLLVVAPFQPPPTVHLLSPANSLSFSVSIQLSLLLHFPTLNFTTAIFFFFWCGKRMMPSLAAQWVVPGSSLFLSPHPPFTLPTKKCGKVKLMHTCFGETDRSPNKQCHSRSTPRLLVSC